MQRIIPSGLLCQLVPASATGPREFSITAEARRPKANTLSLWFTISGDQSSIELGRGEDTARADGLWQHTCFEAFVRSGKGQGYFELNFTASNQWAAYRFDDYRDGMRNLDCSTPSLNSASIGTMVSFGADFLLDHLSGIDVWQIGLSAVIEETDDTKSYWALAHPPGKPDFHHPTCFAAELPAPDAA